MVTVHEQIKELQTKANGAAKQTDVEALISNKNNVKKLFGLYVHIDASTGAVSLKTTAPA